MYKVTKRFIGSRVTVTRSQGFGKHVVLSEDTPQKVLKALSDLGLTGIEQDSGTTAKKKS